MYLIDDLNNGTFIFEKILFMRLRHNHEQQPVKAWLSLFCFFERSRRKRSWQQWRYVSKSIQYPSSNHNNRDINNGCNIMIITIIMTINITIIKMITLITITITDNYNNNNMYNYNGNQYHSSSAWYQKNSSSCSSSYNDNNHNYYNNNNNSNNDSCVLICNRILLHVCFSLPILVLF